MGERLAWRWAAVLAAIVAAVSAAAGQAPSPQLVVIAAEINASGDTVTITGQNFGDRPFITLDLVPLDIVYGPSGTQVVAALPINVSRAAAATYLLTVSRGPSPTENGSYELTIGTASATADKPDIAPIARPTPSPQLPQAPPLGSPAESRITTPAETVAVVGDRAITLAEVDREWRRVDPAGYATLSEQMFRVRRKVVEALIADQLLALEAAERGLTVDDLLKEELPKRSRNIPEFWVESMYRGMGDRARGATLDQLRPALRAWLERRGPEFAKLIYLEELTKTSTRVRILLEPPRVAVEQAAQDAALGPPTAPVEVVAFGDLRSAEYARLAQALGKVRDTYADRVRVVFKNLPAAGNDDAVSAAEAAQCAKAQGQFWAYHDALVARLEPLSSSALKQIAGDAGLNRAEFDRCFDAGEFRALIRQAVEEAGRYSIQSSPGFLVNGRVVRQLPSLEPPFELLKTLIEEELLLQARKASPARR